MSSEERWLPVPGYEDLYSVSDQGRVRRDAGGERVRAGRILKPARQSGGHLFVSLCRDGVPRAHRVHRLVLAAFVGPCPEGMESCHNNGDPTDNRLCNLRYDTRSENRLDMHRQGRRRSYQRFAEAQAIEIIARIDAGETCMSIARDYGVPYSTVGSIKYGKSWRYLRTHGPLAPAEGAAA